MIKNVNKYFEKPKENNAVEVQQLPPGYVMGPKGRLIKVGGKIYNQLIRDQIMEPVPEQPEQPEPKKKPSKNVVKECKNNQQAMHAKYQLMKEAPLSNGQIYAIANDKKTVMTRKKKSKQPSIGDMTGLVAKATANVHKKLEGKYDSDDDLEADEKTELFKQMIMQEMINLQNRNNKKISVNNITNDDEESEYEEDENDTSSDCED